MTHRRYRMKIKYYKPKVITGKAKCTIHQNGKMGFSRQAIKKLGLDTNRYAKIGFNEEDENDKALYLKIQRDQDEDAYKINKAGEYFYLNTKYLFDDLNIDYVRKKIIYDIQEIEIEQDVIYRLNKRELARKKSRQL